MATVVFQTFGCKLNQAETAALTQDFIAQGYQVVSPRENADVYVINTCTVTGRSDGKCRRAINRILRVNPKATILVVGCFCQVNPEILQEMKGVDYIFGTQEKHDIFRYFPGPGKLKSTKIFVQRFKASPLALGRQGDFKKQTRAFLKIQDGCNNRCAYCIVPAARGPSRSLPQAEILQNAKKLLQHGHQEIVLTGVHVGDYGKDENSQTQLPELLAELLHVSGMKRLRLSSLNPEDITSELISLMKQDNRICRHFHIPIQSGSDAILHAMNRSYTTRFIRERIEKIHQELGKVGLGGDIIVGFPGESNAHFEETVQFIQSLPITYLHVFPFSRRPGTKAFQMPDQVKPQAKKERAQILRTLGEEKKNIFIQSWLNKNIEVLLESKNLKGWMGGFSSEYVRVEVPFDKSLINQIISVQIEEVHQLILRGSIIK